MSKLSSVELVVFDMAGTTVKDNNEVLKCFLESAKNSNLIVEESEVNGMMGWAKKVVFKKLWEKQLGKNHPDYLNKVETSYQDFKERLEFFYESQPIEPMDGCLEIFAWLKSQDVKIALNTGFYRKVTNIILGRLGWDVGLNEHYIGSKKSVIQASITPSEIYNNEGRPAPYMIQKAMYRLGVKDSQKVISIGDTPVDLEAGRNANCLLSLGVTNGSHSREQLGNYSNDGLLSSLSEFKNLFSR